MTNKPGDRKIGAISGSNRTEGVKPTESVGEVAGIKPTSAVGGVRSASGVGKRRPTRIMSSDERDDLFRLINEEAEKLFGSAGLSEEKKSVLKNAVKMAVDSGLIDESAPVPSKKNLDEDQ